MKEHPILFSGPMVRALLADRKFVTRRLSKQWLKVKAGDRLWVRETHWRLGIWAKNGIAASGRQRWTFKPTRGEFVRFVPPDVVPKRAEHGWHKRPSLFLPRWASRILLEAEEDARLERLQDITEEDARAEGIEVGCRATAPDANRNICVTCGEHRSQHIGVSMTCFGSYGGLFSTQTFRGGFAFLWGQLHTKPGERWADNPEVVRVGKFRRVS